ncbi:MAG TPA: Rv3235 family protein [Nocardioidaceae bacterium]|nr:Rv3235 family protein [Nocardioidaceae bacterium]
MTAQTTSPNRRRSVRRPPAPPDGGATVIPLVDGARRRPEPVPLAAVQGTLALDLRGCTGMPGTPELKPRLNLVDGDGRAVDEVEAWAARFAQAVVEVLGGDRPLSQLVRWTTSRVYADLGRRVRILARTAPARQRLRTVRPQVRSVRVFQPTPASAEVSVHVRHGRRSRALAARLQLDDDHWQCTDLELG